MFPVTPAFGNYAVSLTPPITHRFTLQVYAGVRVSGDHAAGEVAMLKKFFGEDSTTSPHVLKKTQEHQFCNMLMDN